jgi:hypothetical protein
LNIPGDRFFVMVGGIGVRHGDRHTMQVGADVVILISKNIQVLEIDSAAPNHVGTAANVLDQFTRGPLIGAAVVVPAYAAAVGLASEAESSRPVPPERLIDNGVLALEIIRDTVRTAGRAALRRLCGWFPFALRMPEVQTFLDGLPPPKAWQTAGQSPGRGRPRAPDEQLRLIATMDLLVRETGIRPAEAARKLAMAVKHLNITARRLENLYSAFRSLVCCLEGYQIPASAVSQKSWGEPEGGSLIVHAG